VIGPNRLGASSVATVAGRSYVAMCEMAARSCGTSPSSEIGVRALGPRLLMVFET